MHTALPYPQPKTALSLWAFADRAAPPSEHVVAAVLAFGDLRDEREDGATLIRFSSDRLERADMRLLLGEELPRAAQVSVIWDEQEEQLLQVLDAAPLVPRARLAAVRPSGNAYADARMRGSVRSLAPERAAAA